MTEKDVGIFLGLVKELAESEQNLHKVIATEEGLKNCFFGPRRYAEAVLIEVVEQVIGYAVYFFTNSTYSGKPCLFLEDMYIQPEYRGKGIGKAVFMHIVQLAENHDCVRVDWIAAEWKKEAQDFYLSLGAIVRDTMRPYRLEKPAMEKLLSRAK
jgi:GNAT superfamily N-acetyltransferase